MKIWKKAAALLLLVCVLLPLAVSCADKEEEEDPNLLVLFTPEGVINYTIVLPENASGTVTESASMIVSALQVITGVEPEVKTDAAAQTGDDPSSARELLIGDTNRAESAEAKQSLGEAPYVIKAFDSGRIAIVGADDLMTANAVLYFTKNLLKPYQDGGNTMTRGFSYTAEVPDKPVTLYPDGSYRIKLAGMPVVYGAESGFVFMEGTAKAYAKRASLPCTSDAEAANEGPEILLGKCAREDFVPSPKALLFRDFYISVKNDKISVDAISIYGFEAAFRFLDEALKNGYLDLPAEGLLVEYDYGDTQLARILKNYENPYVEGAWPVVVAHRGNLASNTKNPENSIISYTGCIENKIDIIETDVHQTKDGVWVICHDGTLRRTGVGNAAYLNKDISGLTFKKLRTVNLRRGSGGDNMPATDQKVPTLDEIIELGKDKVLYNIDKTTMLEMFKPVYEVFEKAGAVDSAMFKSGESAELIAGWFAELIEAGRKLPLFAPMIYSGDDQKVTDILSFKGMSSMTETHYNITISNKNEQIVAAAKEANIRLMVLTIDASPDSDTTWKTHLEKGVTGIMTNNSQKFVGLYQK